MIGLGQMLILIGCVMVAYPYFEGQIKDRTTRELENKFHSGFRQSRFMIENPKEITSDIQIINKGRSIEVRYWREKPKPKGDDDPVLSTTKPVHQSAWPLDDNEWVSHHIDTWEDDK